MNLFLKVHSVFSEKMLYGLTKHLKVLIFFKSKCQKNACMEAKERYTESKVMVSIMYFGFNCMFLFNFHVLFPGKHDD